MSIKYLFYLVIITSFISCNDNIKQSSDNQTITEVIDPATTVEPGTINLYSEADQQWFKKDLFNPEEKDDYFIESPEIFRTRFDSIMKLNNWDIRANNGKLEKKKNYSTLTMQPAKDIEIILKVNSNNHVSKILLFSGIGADEDFYKTLVRIMKGLILSTLNSNYDLEDAEMILHMTGVLSMPEYFGPGVLLLDGHKYETHRFKYKNYFGISPH